MMVRVNISGEHWIALDSTADRPIREANQDGNSTILFTEFVKVSEKMDVVLH